MKRLHTLIKVLLAGALAGLGMAILFLILDLLGIFASLGISMATPANLVPWLPQKILEGALFALLFLIPALSMGAQWIRGLVFGLIPTVRLWFIAYPMADLGWLGLNLGIGVPVTALVLSLGWGVLAGWLLDRWEGGWRRASAGGE